MTPRRLAVALVAISLLVSLGATTAAAQPAGVTLYSGKHLTGSHETFYGDVPDLARTRFGSDRASSISVPPGCVAILYERPHYRGRFTKFRDVDNDLGNTLVGDDRTSSLRVRCEGSDVWGGAWDAGPRGGPHGPQPRLGVTLFRERYLRGPSQTFFHDVPDLARTSFGSRQASSIAVPPGCVAVIFDRPLFRGRSTSFRDNDNNLGNTLVGDNAASSMKVYCGGEREMERDGVLTGGRPVSEGRLGVTLYRDRRLSGPYETFYEDVPDLSRTGIGARTASSIGVPRGCLAILYEYPYFRGRSTTFRDDDNDLGNTAVGRDTASSLKVHCMRP